MHLFDALLARSMHAFQNKQNLKATEEVMTDGTDVLGFEDWTRPFVQHWTGKALHVRYDASSLAGALAKPSMNVASLRVGRPKSLVHIESVAYQQGELLDFSPASPGYDLIAALSVLPFLDESVECVIDKFISWLNIGGRIMVETFTTGDALYKSLKKNGKPAGRNRFVHPKTQQTWNFVDPNQVWRHLTTTKNIRIVHYYEGVIYDHHPPVGPHRHGICQFVADKID